MKKMAIIVGYAEGETYGLLGPQMAATLIEELTPYPCIVIAVTHADDKGALKKSLYDYFGKARPIVGFSNLNGRQDLFLLAKGLKEEGAFTLLAGPQSDVDYPTYLNTGGNKKIRIAATGCSFCDVATDKGFFGTLDLETVLSQIRCLPDVGNGRKIAFELINENALPGLPRLIRECSNRKLSLSEIRLTLRADWFLRGEPQIREALGLARKLRLRIRLSSMGFESFDNRILKNLNKGVTVKVNIEAIRLMRRLKREFPFQWAYSTGEGAVHGFIHPTPWDSDETDGHVEQTVADHRLAADILPPHSIPLIIHHASGLAHWMREIERKEGLFFKRYVSVIGWWPEALMDAA